MLPAAVLLVLAAALAAASAASKFGELETVHEWVQLDFDWASAEAREAALAPPTSRFVPDHCVLMDVKAVDGEVFVTVPRMRHGVPSSVNRVLSRGNDTVLQPYPSWEFNTPGDCQNIQNSYAIEIDPLRRMWIVDSGTRDTFTRPNRDCQPKLVVWDMVKDKEVRRFVFPEEQVSKQNGMLRGVVLDTVAEDPEDWFAYVADTGNEQLLVYSWRQDAAWNVTHSSMKFDVDALAVHVGKEQASFPTPIDSLALSPRDATEPRLFFAAVSNFKFYSIHTEFLRNRTVVSQATGAALDAEITLVGTRSSQSEGMTISDAGIMFYSVLNANAVNQWNTSVPFSAMDQVYRDDTRLQWTDSFGWDDGFLYVTSNRWHKAAMLDFEEGEVMYRLMRARVDMDGYMGAYRRGQRVGVAGAAPPRAANAAVTLAAALLCAAIATTV